MGRENVLNHEHPTFSQQRATVIEACLWGARGKISVYLSA